jgi:hypothetical protein
MARHQVKDGTLRVGGALHWEKLRAALLKESPSVNDWVDVGQVIGKVGIV